MLEPTPEGMLGRPEVDEAVVAEVTQWYAIFIMLKLMLLSLFGKACDFCANSSLFWNLL